MSLRERSIEVDQTHIGTSEFQSFLDDLIETMIVEDGIGIASPQVGKNIRVFIVNEKFGPKAYINPEVTPIGEPIIESEEGCLSVPGVWGIVMRTKKAKVKALDRHGRRVEFEVKGFMAIVFQHEFDHLNGVLFIDKAIRTEQANQHTKQLV